jgi:mannose-6-phosphate isomerase-like protein (cupin superfamily)
LGKSKRGIKKGDLIFIPKGTPHAVKTISAVPLKVISVQSPLFDGSDRIMIDP